MAMNYSQKVARFFEICDYILLIPVIFLLFFALIGLLGGVIIFLLPFLIFTVGLLLFIGCSKHSRANLDEEWIFSLWFWTIIFNLIPLLVMAYYIRSSQNSEPYQTSQESNIFPYLCISFWFLNICLAISAIWFEVEENTKNVRMQKILLGK